MIVGRLVAGHFYGGLLYGKLAIIGEREGRGIIFS